MKVSCLCVLVAITFERFYKKIMNLVQMCSRDNKLCFSFCFMWLGTAGIGDTRHETRPKKRKIISILTFTIGTSRHHSYLPSTSLITYRLFRLLCYFLRLFTSRCFLFTGITLSCFSQVYSGNN